MLRLGRSFAGGVGIVAISLGFRVRSWTHLGSPFWVPGSMRFTLRYRVGWLLISKCPSNAPLSGSKNINVVGS